MTLLNLSPLGAGAYGDVYQATDDRLNRVVAVKIVRPAVGSADALSHARALARVHHHNVVIVYDVTTVADPESPTGDPIPCIVMEHVAGITLAGRLRRGVLTRDEVLVVGRGLLDGIAAIHGSGIAHGDLHDGNVMIREDGHVKIIDLHHLSGSTPSTATMGQRVASDLAQCRAMLQDILLTSTLGPEASVGLASAVNRQPALDQLRTAFEQYAQPPLPLATDHRVEDALATLRDTVFVEGQSYADALLSDTPSDTRAELLRRMIRDRYCEAVHHAFVRSAWRSLDATEKSLIAHDLSLAIDAEVPQGNWVPLFRLLSAFGKAGWDLLRARTRMRLANALLTDLREGRLHGRGGVILPRGGNLAKWIVAFWPNLDRDALIAAMAAMLHEGWYTQNYVAEHFMAMLPRLADTPERETLLIEALARAVRNKAQYVLNNVHKLPAPWRDRIDPPEVSLTWAPVQ